MAFLSLSVLGFILITSKISSGQQYPLPVHPVVDRIRQLLAYHGLPSDIIDCVVARQNNRTSSLPSYLQRISNSRYSDNNIRKRKVWIILLRRKLGTLRFVLLQISNPSLYSSLEEKCQNNRQQCLDVLECSKGRISQLNFLNPPKTTTTTTTTIATATTYCESFGTPSPRSYSIMWKLFCQHLVTTERTSNNSTTLSARSITTEAK